MSIQVGSGNHRVVQIILLVLIVIGLGLLATQQLWVPKLVDYIMRTESSHITPLVGGPEKIACLLDAKLCPDGSTVGRSGPGCQFALCPSVPGEDDRIHVLAPLPKSVISSPLEVRGEARGGWYFEGSFPITIKDESGQILGQGAAQAEGEWMTSEFVPFRATIIFVSSGSITGSLVLSKDNPSGLPENSAEVTIPISLR